MYPRGHELAHSRSMNWVQSAFIPCRAFLFFARTSRDILGHVAVSSTTLHALPRALALCALHIHTYRRPCRTLLQLADVRLRAIGKPP